MELRNYIIDKTKIGYQFLRWIPRFWSRIITIDGAVGLAWGELIAKQPKNGRVLPAIDSLIAASAIAHNLQIVTRNTKDFEGLNIPIVNPWILS